MVDQVAVTQADLQKLDAEDKWFEVVDSVIIESERDIPPLHWLIISNLYDILKPFVKSHLLGSIFMDGVRFIIEGTADNVQWAPHPDLAFVRSGRILADFDWTNDFVLVPDLVVEVVSPGQSNPLMLGKISRYLRGGCEEAWLIYPARKTVVQYRADTDVPAIYHEGDIIDVSALFPSLTLKVNDLFITP
jgi:Uma2 family endonuclease